MSYTYRAEPGVWTYREFCARCRVIAGSGAAMGRNNLPGQRLVTQRTDILVFCKIYIPIAQTRGGAGNFHERDSTST